MDTKSEVIFEYYHENMVNYDMDHAKLGWESKQAHEARFDVFLSNIKVEGKRLADIGCGLGSLLGYIKEKGLHVEYTGIDILEMMIHDASQRYPEERFFCGDIFADNRNPFKEKEFDVSYASGLFNLNLGNNQDFFEKALDVMFYISGEAVVFNLLHYQSPGRDNRYYYFKPKEVVSLLQSGRYPVKELKIVEDYLQNDFTVICKR